ncbi:MAG: hypothetical protein JWM53_6078 [bacterium]|nr:hypothetical protein [bacterium]
MKLSVVISMKLTAVILAKLTVVIFLLAAVGGCVRVKPYERELLAKPTMTFQPDPHEDVLDNHMLEAREGAAGGYGSAGGGCGCN